MEIERATLESYAGHYSGFVEVMDVYLQGDQLKKGIYGFSFNLDPPSETLSQPRNCLEHMGLASILRTPVYLRLLEAEFMPGDETSADAMIIHPRGIGYEICPEYPQIGEIPPLCDELTGEYDLLTRLASGRHGTSDLGQTIICKEAGVLQMGGAVSSILPISGTEIINHSGSFASETSVYSAFTALGLVLGLT